MNARRSTPKGEGAPKKKKITKRDAAMFRQYGFQPPGVEHDEFHEHYEPYDWRRDPELPHNLSVTEGGGLSDRTRETLSLIQTFASAFDVDGGPMPMEHWARVTGYKEPSLEERKQANAYSTDYHVVLASGDKGNEELLTETYGPAVPSTKLVPVPVVIAETPDKIDWGMFPGRELLSLPPFHFTHGPTGHGWEELDGAMATLQTQRLETIEFWYGRLANQSLKLYMTETPLRADLSMVYHYSVGNRLFVATLFQTVQNKRRLCKYFFINPLPKS